MMALSGRGPVISFKERDPPCARPLPLGGDFETEWPMTTAAASEPPHFPPYPPCVAGDSQGWSPPASTAFPADGFAGDCGDCGMASPPRSSSAPVAVGNSPLRMSERLPSRLILCSSTLARPTSIRWFRTALASGSDTLPPRPKRKLEEHSDAEIERALEGLKQGALQISHADIDLIRELAERGARDLKARRDGGRKPRANSGAVTQRMVVVLDAYRRLSLNRQAHHTGKMTLLEIQKSLKKLGLNVTEDTIKNDLQQMDLLLRLIREGIVPPPGPKPPVNRKLPKKTQKEMIAGKRTLARNRHGD